MKHIFLAFIICIFFCACAYGKQYDDSGSNNNDFKTFGKYIQTFEINDEKNNELVKIQKNDNFEEESINEISKRYEENAVELKLDNIDEEVLNTVNNERIFKLEVNETHYNIEQNIKNENIIWDNSKLFSRAFYTESEKLTPIPSLINSSILSSKINNDLTAKLGQVFLYDQTGHNLLFVRLNESIYNTGSVLNYQDNGLNISVGSFTSSGDNTTSGGVTIASNSLKLPNNIGSLSFGGAYYSKEYQTDNMYTGGLFGEYSFKRLKINAQIGKRKFTGANAEDTSLYLIPEYQLSDSLYLSTRLIRNVTQNIMQDELVLTYTPKRSNRNLSIEINASNQYTNTDTIKQRIKLTTSFKI